MGADYNAVKDIPGYKIIMKAILKSQIQHLVDQLSVEAEEETVMLTASMTDGMLCHLGSNSGKIFLDNHEDFKSMFLNFCLKEKHEKRQQEKQLPSGHESSRNRPSPGPIRPSKQAPQQTKQISTPPQSSTPRARSVRMQPYPVSKPTKTPTATSQKINQTSTTSQRQNETATTSQTENKTSNPEVATIKKEPFDPELVTLPDTIEGYQILRTEADPAEGEQDPANTGDKETDGNKQNGQTGQSDSTVNTSANVQQTNAAISGANGNAKPGASDIDKQGVKPESLAEAELDTTDADMDVSVNIDDSLDMSELEQPGPSGLASGDGSSLEQSDQLNSASDETGELDNKPFQFNYVITEPGDDDGPSNTDFPVVQGNKSFDSSMYGDLSKFWMQTEDQATIKQMRWATKLLQDMASFESLEDSYVDMSGENMDERPKRQSEDNIHMFVDLPVPVPDAGLLTIGDGELLSLVDYLPETDVIKVIHTLAHVLFTEEELVTRTRTGKRTHKCLENPRPPLDPWKLNKLETIVMKKTHITRQFFVKKFENMQKVLRRKIRDQTR